VFPYRVENQTQRTAYVTIGIISLCVFVWILVDAAGMGTALPETVCNLGLIPGELTGMLSPGVGLPRH
jgi:hypothetical protein